MVIRRRAAAKLLDAGLEPALKLKIIVGIEDVVLAIVLILMNDFDFGEPLAEQARWTRSRCRRCRTHARPICKRHRSDRFSSSSFRRR